MHNIIAQNPNTKKEVIVENFVTHAGKALKWWTKYGMTHVVYFSKPSKVFKRI